MKNSHNPNAKLSVAQILMFTHLKLPPLNPPSHCSCVLPSFVIVVCASYLPLRIRIFSMSPLYPLQCLGNALQAEDAKQVFMGG